MSLVHYALVNRALTLVVAATGSMSLAATSTGYRRTTGSFLIDKFAPGMEIAPTGFTDNTVRVVKQVTDLDLYTTVAPPVQAAASARALTAGFPSAFARENLTFTKPTDGRGYAEESFEPLRQQLESATLQPGARVTKFGNMRFLLYVPIGTGDLGLRTSADALADLYPLGWAMSLADGSVLRTRNDFPANAGSITPLTTGFTVCPVTIPWRHEYTVA